MWDGEENFCTMYQNVQTTVLWSPSTGNRVRNRPVFEVHLLHAIGCNFRRPVNDDVASRELGVGGIHIRTAKEQANVPMKTFTEIVFSRGAFFVKLVGPVQHKICMAQAQPAPVKMVRVVSTQMGEC
jgi:hypothetical protein